MNNEFVWNDALVAEYVGSIKGFERDLTPLTIEQFKKSKQLKPNKDWEIVSFDIMDEIFGKVEAKKESNSQYGRYLMDEQQMIKHFPIHSVRRLTDNLVFSVDDDTAIRKIDSFSIDKSVNDIKVHYKEGGWDYLSQVKKAKHPVFTTSDGVSMFDDDEYYKVWDNLLYTKYYASKGGEYPSKYTRTTFSTEDAAKKYVLFNSPKLSINDVLKLSEEIQFHNRIHDRADEDYYAVYVSLLKVRLLELAKERLNKP